MQSRMYVKGQRVIERTYGGPLGADGSPSWRDEEVEVIEAGSSVVITESGLTYTPHGVSDLTPPYGYRSIRAVEYRVLGSVKGALKP
jgi:hypothetical protein